MLLPLLGLSCALATQVQAQEIQVSGSGVVITMGSPLPVQLHPFSANPILSKLWSLSACSYNLYWHGENRFGEKVASGAYLIVLKTERGVRTEKVVMLR